MVRSRVCVLYDRSIDVSILFSVHYYNYVINNWNINQYPRTRFASEYGVQSIPSITTLRSVAVGAKDLERNSTFMKHRQHLVGGYESMENLISSNFNIPRTSNATNDLISYIYLSQVNQAVSVKIQTESYRQARSELNSLGEGMTMGALYWQLNDVWQAPSWSSIGEEKTASRCTERSNLYYSFQNSVENGKCFITTLRSSSPRLS